MSENLSYQITNLLESTIDDNEIREAIETVIEQRANEHKLAMSDPYLQGWNDAVDKMMESMKPTLQDGPEKVED